MTTNTYTEDEFKKVLKTLFAEKKRVKELQKRLEGKGIYKKFQTKLTDIHKHSITDEYTTLKSAYAEKEKENTDLKIKLDKIRPAIKKIVEELKAAQLKNQELECNGAAKEQLKKALEELERIKEQEQKERDRFEAERSRLVERMAEELSSVQRQSEIIKELQEELFVTKEQHELNIEKLKAEFEEENQELKARLALAYEELEREKALAEKGSYPSLQQAVEEISAERDQAEQKFEASYAKMRELSARHAEMLSTAEEKRRLEKELASAYTALQNTKHVCEEREAEIRKAQYHLAKKVKETTILRDLSDRQNAQIAKQQNELEQMQNSLNMQQLHEEKMHSMAKERAQSAETLAKEWQEKFLSLQQEWQDEKAELLELRKLREEYGEMAATVASLKNILGKRDEG